LFLEGFGFRFIKKFFLFTHLPIIFDKNFHKIFLKRNVSLLIQKRFIEEIFNSFEKRFDKIFYYSLLDLNIKAKNVVRVFPIVYSKKKELEVKRRIDVLVYANKSLVNKILSVARDFRNINFFIISKEDIFNNEKNIDNVFFLKRVSFEEFNYLLYKSKVVISNSGINTIILSIYFKKPIISIPYHNHIEQLYNSYLIKELGIGISDYTFKKEQIEHIFSNYDEFLSNIEKVRENVFSKKFKNIWDIVLEEVYLNI